jgi:predicted secreted protein
MIVRTGFVTTAAATLVATWVTACHAQEAALPAQPVVAVSASATASIANDRMQAWLRVESENADPAAAASSVNARMAGALARAKATSGVDARTLGYSTYQLAEKGQPPRWRVVQTLSLDSADFTALSGLVTRLQSADGLLLSGMQFTLADGTRRKVEDQLTLEAIKAWQQRAQQAAQGFGSQGWRAGRVAIQTNDFGRPQPVMMRAQAGAMAAGGAPVAAEGGTTDVTVTVSGDAILESARIAPR